MPSIVLELQRDSLDPAVAVFDLLRKALFIATKLDIPEFKIWIEHELGGYSDCDSNSTPSYRIGFGRVMALDEWHRWIPVLFPSGEQNRTASKVVFSDSVAQIEALIQRTIRDKKITDLRIDFRQSSKQYL
jgi:AbiTii